VKGNHEERSGGRLEYISILLVMWGNELIMLLLSFLIIYTTTHEPLLAKVRLGI
jgi:hypothetical protein